MHTAIVALEIKLLAGSGTTGQIAQRFGAASAAIDAQPARRRNAKLKTRLGKANRYLAKRGKRGMPKGKGKRAPATTPIDISPPAAAPRVYRRADTFREFIDQF